jgi:membrane associated rhomboid family serine protease
MVRVTFTLIGLNVVVFALQIALSGFTELFSLTPEMAFGGAWWQFLTYMFLHGGPMHIMINMFILFLFGEIVERALGQVRYLMLYLISGIGSAVVYMVLTGFFDSPMLGTSMLGASGAVFGIMAAYGLMFPKERIWVPIFLIPLPAFTVVILFAILEFALGLFGLEEGIANFGHFGGIITGILMTWYWKKTARPRNVNERRNFEFFWE